MGVDLGCMKECNGVICRGSNDQIDRTVLLPKLLRQARVSLSSDVMLLLMINSSRHSRAGRWWSTTSLARGG